MTRRFQSADYDAVDREEFRLPASDQEALTRQAEAAWAAQRKEPGVVPAGNASSVNTGEIVSRVTRVWSKYHE